MVPLQGQHAVGGRIGQAALERDAQIILMQTGLRGRRQRPAEERNCLGHRIDVLELGKLLALDGHVELARIASIIGCIAENPVPVLGVEQGYLVGLASLDSEIIGQFRCVVGIVAAFVYEELPGHNIEIDIAFLDFALLICEGLRVGVARRASQ